MKEKKSKSRSVTTSSTSWSTIEILAISNYDDEISISERKWNKKAGCYVRSISFQSPDHSVDKVMKILNHVKGNCVSSECTYCKRKY